MVTFELRPKGGVSLLKRWMRSQKDNSPGIVSVKALRREMSLVKLRNWTTGQGGYSLLMRGHRWGQAGRMSSVSRWKPTIPLQQPYFSDRYSSLSKEVVWVFPRNIQRDILSLANSPGLSFLQAKEKRTGPSFRGWHIFSKLVSFFAYVQHDKSINLQWEL